LTLIEPWNEVDVSSGAIPRSPREGIINGKVAAMKERYGKAVNNSFGNKMPSLPIS
jgi:hypothetical protein